MVVEELKVRALRFVGSRKAVAKVGSRFVASIELKPAGTRKTEDGEEAVLRANIVVSVVNGDAMRPLPPIIIEDVYAVDAEVLRDELQFRCELGPEEAGALAEALDMIIKNFELYRLGYEAKLLEAKMVGLQAEEMQRLAAISIAAKPTAREELIEMLVSMIMERRHMLTLHDDLLCYEEGIYRECEAEIRAETERLVKGSPLKAKLNRYIIAEVVGKLKRRTFRKPEEVERHRFVLAFKNGLLDVKRFVETGALELQPFNPEVYAFHKIPHALNTELYRQMVEEEKLYALTTPVDIPAVAEKYTPRTWKTYVEWVGEEPAPLLYEIEGYCLYPDYPLHKAFMAVGEGSNGKTTWLTKLIRVLGRENVVSVSLLRLANPNDRFTVAELHRKLANIVAEPLKGGHLLDTDTFKKLTGGDIVMGERKFRDPFYFTNYAKMIFSANRLPEVSEDTYAWWRRWVMFKFPNQFPEDPTFFDRTFTEAEIEAGIIVSLLALRNVLLRRSFTEPMGREDIKEEWKRLSNNVYRFVREMEEEGYLALDPQGYVEKDELYSMYSKWCSEVDEDPVSKAKFTKELARHFGIRIERPRVSGQRPRVYKGIKVLKDPWKDGEGYEPRGLERYT